MDSIIQKIVSLVLPPKVYKITLKSSNGGIETLYSKFTSSGLQFFSTESCGSSRYLPAILSREAAFELSVALNFILDDNK